MRKERWWDQMGLPEFGPGLKESIISYGRRNAALTLLFIIWLTLGVVASLIDSPRGVGLLFRVLYILTHMGLWITLLKRFTDNKIHHQATTNILKLLLLVAAISILVIVSVDIPQLITNVLAAIPR